MSSNEKKVTFVFARNSFLILCTGKEKFKEIIQKFINKFNPDSKIIDYIFIYEGIILGKDSYEKPIEENEIFGFKESFLIMVEKDIKIINCPKCNYGDCVVSLKDYKATFYNCQHYHLLISSYDNFFQDQIYYPERIVCADCQKNSKSEPLFLVCLTCRFLMNREKTCCCSCIKKHLELGHTAINYEDKNYYCFRHCKKVEKYCFQCLKNLCDDCVKEHLKVEEKKEHKIKSFESLVPEEKEIAELKNSLEVIKKNTESLRIIIDDLTYTMKGSIRLYENYYKIASNIIEKYESFNMGKEDFKSFTIFKCLRNLKSSNSQILGDLKSITNEKDKIEMVKKIMKFNLNKKQNYSFNDFNEREGRELNQTPDEEWYNEIIGRENKEKPITTSNNKNGNQIGNQIGNQSGNQIENQSGNKVGNQNKKEDKEKKLNKKKIKNSKK